MLRVRTKSAGWDGSPGLTTFYFDSAATTPGDIQSLVDRVRQYFEASKALYVPVHTFTVDPEVALIDPATGNQTDTFVAAAAPPGVVGTGSGFLMPPSTMMLLRLLTAKFVAGRKVQGHSNAGPPCTAVLSVDGTPSPGALLVLQTAGTALADVGGASPDLLVWSRPTVLRAGTTATVVGTSVPDKFSVLRSRRD